MKSALRMELTDSGWHLRPRIPADDPGIVRLHNEEGEDSAPVTVDGYRGGAGAEEYVAVEADRVVGHLGLHFAWWTGRADVHAAELRVARSHRRRGIGSALCGFLRERARALDAREVLAWVREDCPEGRRFAGKHGFRPTGEVIEGYRLRLEDTCPGFGSAAEQRLLASGIRIVRLCDRGLQDEPFLRQLQRLWAGEEATGGPAVEFDVWRAKVLQGPGLGPEWHWLALDGERPVGMTFLKRLGPETAENDYTTVAREYRRRGIARVLKGHALRWAREQRLCWLYTSSRTDNEAIVRLNQSLGYVATGPRMEVRLVLG